MTIRPRVNVPSEVSRTIPASKPREMPPISRPIKKVTATQATTAKAFGKRAANSFTPKSFIEAASAQ